MQLDHAVSGCPERVCSRFLRGCLHLGADFIDTGLLFKVMTLCLALVLGEGFDVSSWAARRCDSVMKVRKSRRCCLTHADSLSA